MHNPENKTTIIIAAGGTGGHILPGLAVAHCLSKQSLNVVWIGTAKGIESTLVPEAGYHFEKITAVRLRGRNFFDLLWFPWLFSSAILKSLHLLIRHRPALVLGMGGFVAAPVGVIAFALGISLIIHEQNAIIGMTNRLLARLSKQVLLGFSETIKLPNAKYVGNPVRASICALSPHQERYQSRQGAIHLAVIGGSQGAMIFNQIVPAAIALMEPVRRPVVKQQTGKNNLQAVRNSVKELGLDIELFEFIDDMADIYSWADLVLCRAGAISVSEIAVAGVASVLIPYPQAVDDHQTANAEGLVSHNAAILLPQEELTPNKLAVLMEGFVGRRDDLMQMGSCARSLARPLAADAVAEACLRGATR